MTDDRKGGPTQSCMGIGCTLKCDNRGSIMNGEGDQPIVSIKASLMQGLKQAWSFSLSILRVFFFKDLDRP